MGISTGTSDSQKELQALLQKWRKCKRCPLHRHRKIPVEPVGYADEGVGLLFVIDRLPLSTMYGDPLDESNHLWILERLLSHLEDGPCISELWVTPTALCPTRSPVPGERAPDMMPLPRTNHIRECRERLHREIHILQPKVVVACGSEALKALHVKNPPKYKQVFGTISEVYVQGDLVPYPVPLMTTYALTTLDRSGQSDPQIWNNIYAHLTTALRISKELTSLENNDAGKD